MDPYEDERAAWLDARDHALEDGAELDPHPDYDPAVDGVDDPGADFAGQPDY
jgi:hypothetical protein